MKLKLNGTSIVKFEGTEKELHSTLNELKDLHRELDFEEGIKSREEENKAIKLARAAQVGEARAREQRDRRKRLFWKRVKFW